VGGDERGRPADAAGGVHTHHRLAGRAERVGQVRLGHDDALEHVGGPADDGGVDVLPAHLGVLERAARGLAHEAGDGDVGTGRLVMRLADADDGAELAHASPSSTHTRLCCSAGPDVAWATARLASPVAIRWAASPMRVNPAAITTFVVSAPPERFTLTPLLNPSASARIGSWWLNGACSSATSTPSTPAASPAAFVDGECARSRTPRLCASMRCSRPRIPTGLSVTSRARSPAASTMAVAPSEIGGMSCLRSGDTTYGSRSRSSGSSSPETRAPWLSPAKPRPRAAAPAPHPPPRA